MEQAAESTFSTTMPVVVFRYQPGQHPAEWREIDRGPGFFRFPPGEQVVVRARNIDDDELETLINEISNCKAVTFLNLSENRKITSEGMRLLAAMPHLTGINLSSCGLVDIGISRLTVLSRLEHLNLSYCNRISDVGLGYLRKLSRLTYLDLQGCVKVSQKGIAFLLEKKNLVIHS
jgi:Leucine-rich repeat (LRR) protein